jgi:AraC family transcriptional regulator
MLNNSAALKLDSRGYLDGIPHPSPSNFPAATNVHPPHLRRHHDTSDGRGQHDDRGAIVAINQAVDIAPGEVATRRARRGDGMAAEIVQTIQQERIDIRFHAPVHLLVIVEEGVRVAGESSVEGLPRSTLRDLRRKLTFVPAGHNYHEWHQPSLLSRIIYFYFDPAKILIDLEQTDSEVLHAPRLFFEDTALWQTALKLSRLLDAPDLSSELCFEALGVILAHELVRPEAGPRRAEPRARGGLAGWQQRTVIEFIEDNLAENISLAKLAQLIQLSPYHFCRAFKQSFGVPPHRYHTRRRIERAKALLANPHASVTNIGMAIGFSETSSFTAAFRKASGMTPTDYRRGLG